MDAVNQLYEAGFAGMAAYLNVPREAFEPVALSVADPYGDVDRALPPFLLLSISAMRALLAHCVDKFRRYKLAAASHGLPVTESQVLALKTSVLGQPFSSLVTEVQTAIGLRVVLLPPSQQSSMPLSRKRLREHEHDGDQWDSLDAPAPPRDRPLARGATAARPPRGQPHCDDGEASDEEDEWDTDRWGDPEMGNPRSCVEVYGNLGYQYVRVFLFAFAAPYCVPFRTSGGSAGRRVGGSAGRGSRVEGRGSRVEGRGSRVQFGARSAVGLGCVSFFGRGVSSDRPHRLAFTVPRFWNSTENHYLVLALTVLCYNFVASKTGKDRKFSRLPVSASVFTAAETLLRREGRVNPGQKAKAESGEQVFPSVWRDMLHHPLCADIFEAFFSGGLTFVLPRFAKLRAVEPHSSLAKFKELYGTDSGWDDSGAALRAKFICKLSKSIPTKLFVKLIGPADNKRFLKGTPHPHVCAWLRCHYSPVCRALCARSRIA